MTQPPQWSFAPPAGPYPPPRRTGLVIGLVLGGIVVVSMGVIGLVIALSGSKDGGSPGAMSACDLLSDDELTNILGGEVPKPVVDNAPEEQGDKTTTTCLWRGAEADVSIDVYTLESAAGAQEEYASMCAYNNGEASVSGAAEACLISTGSDSPGTVNGTGVVARAGNSVVSLIYIKLGELSGDSEETAVNATSAVLDKLSS